MVKAVLQFLYLLFTFIFFVFFLVQFVHENLNISSIVSVERH